MYCRQVLGLLVEGQGGSILPLLLSGIEPVEAVPYYWYRESNDQHAKYCTKTSQDFSKTRYGYNIAISNLESKILNDMLNASSETY